MERLTYDFEIGGNHCWQVKGADNLECREVCERQGDDGCKTCPIAKAFDRLAAIEDILGDKYDLEDLKKAMWCMQTVKMAFADDTSTIERLRELAQADRLIGSNVYEPNKRGFISVYEIISVHISKCSILVGWNLIDGVYSNLNGFEISALGKTVFLTREDAEAALRREQE